jgi:hypothetical protein
MHAKITLRHIGKPVFKIGYLQLMVSFTQHTPILKSGGIDFTYEMLLFSACFRQIPTKAYADVSYRRRFLAKSAYK